MRPALLNATINILRGKEVLVSYSGGKDSLALLDLSIRYASKVSAFTMELIPGLEVFDEPIRWAEKRFGIVIKRYPHWLRSKLQRAGTYCNANPNTPEITLGDIRAVARAEAKINLIVVGTKKADSLRLRQKGRGVHSTPSLQAPLFDWSSKDVLGYLTARSIPIPARIGAGASSGIDLATDRVLDLYDYHREDYEKLLKAFPYIGAIVYRRKWFGISTDYRRGPQRGKEPQGAQALSAAPSA